MIQLLNKNKIWLSGLIFLPLHNFAQEKILESDTSYFSNALFNTLLVLIIVLLIVVLALGQTLKNIAQSDYVINRNKKEEESKSGGDKIKNAGLILLLFSAVSFQAQTNNKNEWLIGGLDMFTFYSMISMIILEVILILVLYYLILSLLKIEKKVVTAPITKVKTILEKINASVDIEKEHDILLDHDYDGIKELDNDLPPWWKYGFYLTILIGVVYLTNFHVLGTGDLQTAEYEKSMATAKAEIEQYMLTSANNVDETTVKQLQGADLETGKQLFLSTCAACHGKFGEGTVGPNLTDAYWLHSGGISDIFKSIKYGWVDKGMKSWKEDLSPMQIAQVASYIKTLGGTNPPGAKAPQGDLYKEQVVVVANDSLKIVTDSLSMQKDTLK